MTLGVCESPVVSVWSGQDQAHGRDGQPGQDVIAAHTVRPGNVVPLRVTASRFPRDVLEVLARDRLDPLAANVVAIAALHRDKGVGDA